MIKSNSNSIIKKGLWVALFLIILLIPVLIFRYTNANYYSSLLSDFILAPIEKIKTDNNRTNILLLGKADENHAGSDLTDTIIVASISVAEPNIVLVSVPRDIWIPEIRAKVNSAYYWGNEKESGGGLTLAKSTVSQMFDIPIHYGVVLDFSGLKNVINVLGGVEVDVQNKFTDNKYPIAGRENDLCEGDRTYRCRYETITFEKGKQWMDGETVLKFVRSRNSDGDEGTDIAREARQQLVINAVKNKVLTPEFFLSPKKVKNLITVGLQSVETDMDGNSAAVIARKIAQSTESVNYYLIPEELLENPPISPRYDNQYVFVPKSGSWKELQEWIKSSI